MEQLQQTEILVVDDSIDDLALMCGALRTGGYKVIPTSSYRAAINTFRLHSGHFVLLVAAVSLPEKNGCELANTLLATDPSLKILLVSRPSGAAICRFYDMLGQGIHFLEKPLDQERFVKLVRLIVEPNIAARTIGAE
jgi:two-component system cell cycle sensor histidine kinase/response regulator CckA